MRHNDVKTLDIFAKPDDQKKEKITYVLDLKNKKQLLKIDKLP